jgi:gamma-glutamylcyclotransferase (GGCT)/AIG2-like uncharacterized protein YtfP
MSEDLTSQRFLLFSYGTLKDVEFQKLLFVADIFSKEAYLKGYAIYVDSSDGYFFPKKDENSTIYGKILFLTEEQLRKADQWEEIPAYFREKIRVQLQEDNSFIDCWIYMRNSQGTMKSEIIEVANIERKLIIEQIDALNKQLFYSTIPFCDLFLFNSREKFYK